MNPSFTISELARMPTTQSAGLGEDSRRRGIHHFPCPFDDSYQKPLIHSPNHFRSIIAGMIRVGAVLSIFPIPLLCDVIAMIRSSSSTIKIN